MKRILLIAMTAVCGIGLFAWRTLGAPGSPPESKPSAAGDSVVSITLPVVPYELPEGPGKTAVNAACVICHSTRYITMQPAFPRKTWEAEVDKMRKVFGAPVSDAQASEIVTYLMSVRGKPTPATQP